MGGLDRARLGQPHGLEHRRDFPERCVAVATLAIATSVFEASPGNTVNALLSRGDPAVYTWPAPRSAVTRDGGWFGGAPSAPDAPLSSTVLTERDFEEVTSALTPNGFGGPTDYYLNHDVNARYADAAPGGRVLRLPVLFVGAAYDQVADLSSPTALDAMRSTCPDLTEAVVPAGHWLHLKAPDAVNGHLESWLTGQVSEPPW